MQYELLADFADGINDIKDAIDDITKDITILKERFINYTPYMSGNFEGKNFDYEDGRFVFVGWPTTYGLIGKARWLLTVALLSFVPPEERNSFKAAWNLKVDIGEEVPLIDLLFGSLERAAPFHVVIESNLRCRKYNDDTPCMWRTAVECAICQTKDKIGSDK